MLIMCFEFQHRNVSFAKHLKALNTSRSDDEIWQRSSNQTISEATQHMWTTQRIVLVLQLLIQRPQPGRSLKEANNSPIKEFAFFILFAFNEASYLMSYLNTIDKHLMTIDLNNI